LVTTGDGLKCHQCTSYDHTKCGDPFTYEDTGAPKSTEFLKDCPNDGKTYNMCRKIYQNVRGDERIIRSCAYEEYKDSQGKVRDCYKTVLEEYNTYVCTCEGDGCNGSQNIQVSMFSVLCAAILAAVFK